MCMDRGQSLDTSPKVFSFISFSFISLFSFIFKTFFLQLLPGFRKLGSSVCRTHQWPPLSHTVKFCTHKLHYPDYQRLLLFSTLVPPMWEIILRRLNTDWNEWTEVCFLWRSVLSRQRHSVPEQGVRM